MSHHRRKEKSGHDRQHHPGSEEFPPAPPAECQYQVNTPYSVLLLSRGPARGGNIHAMVHLLSDSTEDGLGQFQLAA